MSGAMTIVAWLAALNPTRTRLALPERDGRGRMEVIGPGVILGVAVLVGIAAASRSLLDLLDISPEMFRIAAGLVLVIVAAWMLFTPVPVAEPVPDGLLGAAWPVAFPSVVAAETIVLAITTGASDGVLLGPVVLAGAVLVGLGALPLGPKGRRAMSVTGRIAAAALVLTAVVLAVEGIRQV